MVTTAPLVGQSVKRKEDPRLLTGNGRYLDDIRLPNTHHMAVRRSPYGHANILSIDTEAAANLPGVVGVFTAEDLKDSVKPLPCGMPAGGVENHLPPHRVLAQDRVRYVGDAVAFVVANDPYIAHDAMELIDVQYQELPAVVDAARAVEPGAPQLHDEAPGNICMHWTAGNKDDTDAAFANAEVVVKHHIYNQRLIPNPLETRGTLANYDAGTEETTLWVTSQLPHVHKILLSAFVLDIPEHKLRLIAPEIGGAFGSKIFLYADMALTAWASKHLGVPVKFVETRMENYVATQHGRDQTQDIELAARRDGTMLGLRVKSLANLGAYPSTIAPGVVTALFGRMVSGAYRIPAIWVEVDGVYTNTAMVDAYRGAGRPEATYLVERMVDLLADELAMDPVDVRRKNFIPPDAFPYTPPDLGMLPYDSGNYAVTLDRALNHVNYSALRAQQEEGRKAGRLMGIGISSYVEVCGLAPSSWIQKQGWGGPMYESAEIRVLPTGKISAVTGSLSHGQGHETTFAQIVADEFGVGMGDVEIKYGDTAGAPFGMGTYGSRSLAVGGTALQKSAQKIKEKILAIGANLLEVAPEDVEFDHGSVSVKGAPGSSKTLAEIAFAAWLNTGVPAGMEAGLEATTYYDPPSCTFPFGTHICVVDVDPDTGHVDIIRYVAVDDVGPVVNPMIVDGQLEGGIAQGIGQALFEGAVYDKFGYLLTGSMIDYAVPRASYLPNFELDRTVTPSPISAFGSKGVGEAGTIASTPAVANAVVDALSHLGIRDLQMPITPQRVWHALQQPK
ncbi:MAG: aldehyde oxidase and xanthine dehydrogenase molybdopterin binding [Chloroflexi bacterium]|nr:aldehyde oxidase and xanthine dehydrogenase molybdopterin binding [Chloroflexota bacterium]